MIRVSDAQGELPRHFFEAACVERRERPGKHNPEHDDDAGDNEKRVERLATEPEGVLFPRAVNSRVKVGTNAALIAPLGEKVAHEV